MGAIIIIIFHIISSVFSFSSFVGLVLGLVLVFTFPSHKWLLVVMDLVGHLDPGWGWGGGDGVPQHLEAG